jgi:4-hydroxy-tetrahydrodipicolinate reductase
MRLLLIGHGRMGRLVETLAPEYECEIADIVDIDTATTLVDAPPERWRGVDVAIDFSSPDAVATNVRALARRGLNMVVGTTGWRADELMLREAVTAAGVGIVASANFSTGVVLFEALVARAAQLFAGQTDFGAYVHESHHAAKKDAPSGTALMLVRAMEEAGFARPIDVSSTRAGHMPGAHTVGFDGPAESIVLSHTARDRSTFARGALVAARWIRGRRGWFTMKDVLGL